MSPDVMRKVAKPLLFSAALIWGSTFVMIKDTLDSVPTFYLIAIRFTLGSGVLALACWKRWKQFTPDYLWRGAMAGCFLFLTYLLQTAGLTTTTPSKSAFFTAVYCVMVPFLAWGVAKVRPLLDELEKSLLAENHHFAELSSGKTNQTELIALLTAYLTKMAIVKQTE